MAKARRKTPPRTQARAALRSSCIFDYAVLGREEKREEEEVRRGRGAPTVARQDRRMLQRLQSSIICSPSARNRENTIPRAGTPEHRLQEHYPEEAPPSSPRGTGKNPGLPALTRAALCVARVSRGGIRERKGRAFSLNGCLLDAPSLRERGRCGGYWATEERVPSSAGKIDGQPAGVAGTGISAAAAFPRSPGRACQLVPRGFKRDSRLRTPGCATTIQEGCVAEMADPEPEAHGTVAAIATAPSSR